MKSIRKKRKEVGRKSLLRRFVFLYRLTVVNEDEQRRVFMMRISHLILTLTVLVIAGLGAWGGIAVFRHLPKQVGATRQDYLIRQTIVNEALRIDSLEHVFELQNRYINNLQDIIAGTISLDTVYSVDSLTKVRSEFLMERTEREDNFIKQYEETERYNITSQSQTVNEVSGISMFRPTAGLVSSSYNALEQHLGVDIAASPNQSVVAVLDGTVLLSTYTSEMGYTICIAHPGELISIYKHCESLLKKSGERVKQGEVVALVGRGTDNLLQGSHLHFELWYQGQPIDPEKYILFQ